MARDYRYVSADSHLEIDSKALMSMVNDLSLSIRSVAIRATTVPSLATRSWVWRRASSW